MTKFIALSLLI